MSKNLNIYNIQKSVYSHGQLVGYLVYEKNIKSKKYIYMPMSVLLFGLLNNAFIVEFVRLDMYNRPYGFNGFSLQKLPRVEIVDSSFLRLQLIESLKYVMLQMDKDVENVKVYLKNIDCIASCLVNFPEYEGLRVEDVEEEVMKSLSFYYDTLPSNLKMYCDSFSCKYVKDDTYIIMANKSIVKDVL